jgi:hypothetical protein
LRSRGTISSFEAAKAALMAFTIRPPEELPKVEEVVFDSRRLLSSSSRKKDPSDPAKIKKSAFNSKLKDIKGPRAAGQKLVFRTYWFDSI